MADTERHPAQRDEKETQNIEATNLGTVTEGAPQITSIPSHEIPQPTGSAELPSKADEADEEDSDFDELDDVLDEFSKPKPSSSAYTQSQSTASTQHTAATSAAFDEESFMKQLEQDMASMMSQAGKDSGATADLDPAGFEAAIDKGADAFAKQLEESGIPPGDFLKQLIADVMAEENGAVPPPPVPSASTPASNVEHGGVRSVDASTTAEATGSDENGGSDSFTDAIQRTIERMKESGDRATAAAAESDDLSDDLIAQLLKAVEAGAGGAGGGDDGDLTKMFMGMMEQLSNKEMLYEPMKELDDKFGPWIAAHKDKTGMGADKVSAEDMARYEKQARLVSEIVAKFEDKDYTDEDPKCREYVWEKMQEMQAAGSPPEELIANPFTDDMKGSAAPPDCPQQ